MRRAVVVLMLIIGAAVLLLSACSLGDMPIDLPFVPAAESSGGAEDGSMEEISQEEISQILTRMPTIPPISSPTSIPTIALVISPTARPTRTPTPTQAEPTATPTEAPTEIIAPTKTPTYSGSIMETEVPTLTKTSSAIFSPTIHAGDPIKWLGEPDWSDPMDDGNNWPGGADRYTDIYFGDSTLALVGVSKATGWRVAKMEKLTDFYAEMTVSSGECAAGDAYGMIFRVPDLETPDAGYLFVVNCEGAYSLNRWDGSIDNGKMITMVRWKYSGALNDGPNQNNRIGVMAVGRWLTAYINGVRVIDVSDANYPDGYIGIFVNRYETERYTIFVDELSVWRNP